MIENRTYYFNRLSPSVGELRAHLRITSNDLVDQLQPILLAATGKAEDYIGKIIAQSSFVWSGDFTHTVRLRKPVITVRSVKVDGVTISSYVLSGRDLTIPDSVTGSALEITYDAGMQTVPEPVKHAVKLIAAYMFANPTDTVHTLQTCSDMLLRPYKWND